MRGLSSVSLRRSPACELAIWTLAGFISVGAIARVALHASQAGVQIDDAVTTSVSAAVNQYFLAFSNKDYDALRVSVQAPFVVFNRTGVNTLATADDVVSAYRATMERLDQVQYGATRTDAIRVIPLTAETALANVQWHRDRKDGTLLQEGAEVLMLIKASGAWKISGMLSQDRR